MPTIKIDSQALSNVMPLLNNVSKLLTQASSTLNSITIPKTCTSGAVIKKIAQQISQESIKTISDLGTWVENIEEKFAQVESKNVSILDSINLKSNNKKKSGTKVKDSKKLNKKIHKNETKQSKVKRPKVGKYSKSLLKSQTYEMHAQLFHAGAVTNKAKSFLGGIVNKVRSTFSNTANKVTTAVGSVTNKLKATFGKVANNVKTAFGNTTSKARVSMRKTGAKIRKNN